jgi:hypothetical protein
LYGTTGTDLTGIRAVSQAVLATCKGLRWPSPGNFAVFTLTGRGTRGGKLLNLLAGISTLRQGYGIANLQPGDRSIVGMQRAGRKKL